MTYAEPSTDLLLDIAADRLSDGFMRGAPIASATLAAVAEVAQGDERAHGLVLDAMMGQVSREAATLGEYCSRTDDRRKVVRLLRRAARFERSGWR
jgi:hypothetical protein